MRSQYPRFTTKGMPCRRYRRDGPYTVGKAQPAGWVAGDRGVGVRVEEGAGGGVGARGTASPQGVGLGCWSRCSGKPAAC